MKTVIAFLLAMSMALADGFFVGELQSAPVQEVDVRPPVVTKSPYSEEVFEDDTAVFLANATNYTFVTWYILTPDRSIRRDAKACELVYKGLQVSGERTKRLELSHCPLLLNGCLVEAVFTGPGGQTKTNSCKILVGKKGEPLIAEPAEGTFTVGNQEIRVSGGPEDLIYFELTTPNGKQSGTVASGEYITIPGIPGECYEAFLYLYQVDNTMNNAIYRYTMDCPAEPPTEESTEPETEPETQPPTEAPKLGIGSYSDGCGNSVYYDGGWAEISIVGIGWFGGSGSCDGENIYLSLSDGNGGSISAALFGISGSATLSISDSSLENLPAGSEYYGFTKIG